MERRKSKALVRSGNNVLSGKLPEKSTHDHTIEYRSRGSLAGLTTKLLRFGNKYERYERRQLLEEEKVLHLRAALVMSMTREGELHHCISRVCNEMRRKRRVSLRRSKRN